MKNLPILRNDSSLAVQFSNSVSKTRAILLLTIKIIEMFEPHASIPPMQSAEYQGTIPLKFLIIIHNCANVSTINQPKSLPGFQVVRRHWTALTAGRFRRCWEKKTTRSNRMKFGLRLSAIQRATTNFGVKIRQLSPLSIFRLRFE